jgi:transcriptional regulator with XRE-family HTH domain
MGKIRSMKNIRKVLGAYIRLLREQQKMSQESLAVRAGISYQYLSGVETGKENFSVQVLESLATALTVPVSVLVADAYNGQRNEVPPTVDSKFFRHNVPLPESLQVAHIESAANLTQSIIHRINQNLRSQAGRSLQELIQGNNFSGLVSNIFTNALSECSPYKNNHDQRYPDLIFSKGNSNSIGLEVKTTINIGKGGESHNGHSGWHVIACYRLLGSGDIKFVHIMFGFLNGHQHPESDWRYIGSRVNTDTGSRRTETYNTTLKGTTKLRDGSVYIDTDVVDFSRWRQECDIEVPEWSIFATKGST